MPKTSAAKDGKPNACSADYCNVCKSANALKEKRRVCKHELLDIWSDHSRTPVYTEKTPAEAGILIASMSGRYAMCSHCGLEVTPDATPRTVR